MAETSSKCSLEKFEIQGEIGSGGMAQVFKAFDKEKNRMVALKKILVDPSAPTSHKQRFKGEIQLAKKIRSDYVVRFYEGCYSGNIQYLAMEYVRGRTLKDMINTQGRLQPDQAVDYAIQIARGFSDIHVQEIVHRDLKPSNIMITNNNDVKIIDFGIAISYDSVRLTQTGKVIGSVHYLAPELIDHEEATVQSDIYALGIILYEMLIGKPPHQGKNAIATARKHQTDVITPVNRIYPNIPQALANVVIKATAKNKIHRYQSMREMEKDLSTCLSQRRILDQPFQPDKEKDKRGLFGWFKGSKKRL